jgi:carboxyl-terminal processing protease
LATAAVRVAVTLFATQPRIVLDGARAQAAVADTYRQLSMFGDVFERLRADYEEMPDDSKLESAISGMLAGFDPHSSYMDSKSFRDMQVQTRGEFGGLGIEVTMEDGWRCTRATEDCSDGASRKNGWNHICTGRLAS